MGGQRQKEGGETTHGYSQCFTLFNPEIQQHSIINFNSFPRRITLGVAQ